jgi:hypothetical protein
MDYALLSRVQLRSASDRQDHLRLPPTAAAVPAAVAPEQAANRAYPQPGFTDDEIVFTLAGAMLGRIHLSDYLTAWHRGPFGARDASGAGDEPEATLSIPHLRGRQATARALYPDDAKVSRRSASGALTLALPRAPSACVLSLTP